MTHLSAWQQLGTPLTSSFTARQAMKEADLDNWNVRKWPSFALDPKTRRKIAKPGRVDLVRDNPEGGIGWMGEVGSSYHVIQNEEHADLLDALVEESGATFDHAGTLNEGRQVFITMKLPGHINVGGVDPIENYLAAFTSHDGSMAFTLMVTPIRVYSAALLQVAWKNATHMFRVRHTSGAEVALQKQAREALDLTFTYLDGFQEEAERLIDKPMTQGRFESIIADEFGAPDDASSAASTRGNKKIAELSRLFADSPTQDGIRGTAWAGFNALTEWADHFSPTRGADELRSGNRAQKAILDPSFKNRALQMMS